MCMPCIFCTHSLELERNLPFILRYYPRILVLVKYYCIILQRLQLNNCCVVIFRGGIVGERGLSGLSYNLIRKYFFLNK